MKLYTEEQLRRAIKAGMQIGYSNNFNLNMIHEECNQIVEIFTPIELPSDEQIHDECQIGGMDTNQQLCFQLGAKWMRDKIQGGNK